MERKFKMGKIINKILKKLTPRRIKKELETVKKIQLSPGLQKWVREYEKVGERSEFIWKWLCRMLSIIQLPIISQKYRKSLLEIKVFVVMFMVQLDDVADKKQNWNLLNELLKIPLEQNYIELRRLKSEEKQYLIFTQKLWNYITKRIKRYPKYKELKEVFSYDISQVLNAMKYSYLVNKNPYLINKTEYWLYLPYNMGFFLYFDLDLMCSPNFNFKVLGPMREIIWKAQNMARIGNWVSTWEREIKDKDFTSGIFAYAIDSRAITVDDLRKGAKSKIIKKIKQLKIEKKLLKEWERCYFDIEKLGKKIKTLDTKEFLSRFEKLMTSHLISRGYK